LIPVQLSEFPAKTPEHLNRVLAFFVLPTILSYWVKS